MRGGVKILVGLTFVMIKAGALSQCTGSLISLFPAIVNGVTVTQTFTGSVTYSSSYTICNIESGPMLLGSGGPTSFIQKLTFSSPVNSVLYVLNASDSCFSGNEAFTFSVDIGTLSASQAGSVCLYKQSGNTFTAYVYGAPSNGGYITISSTQPYNSITVSGPGGCNGSFMALCSSSIGIELYSGKEQLSIYPNPSADGKFVIDYSMTNEAFMEIYNINGILVGRYRMSSEDKRIEIRNDKWQDGIYFYKIIGDNLILKSGKIVVLK